MFMIQGPLYVIDRGIGHSAAFENLQPLLRGLLFCHVLDQTIYICTMLYTITVGHKTIVTLPLWKSKSVAQDAKENIPIKGLEAPVWHNGCWIIESVVG